MESINIMKILVQISVLSKETTDIEFVNACNEISKNFESEFRKINDVDYEVKLYSHNRNVKNMLARGNSARVSTSIEGKVNFTLFVSYNTYQKIVNSDANSSFTLKLSRRELLINIRKGLLNNPRKCNERILNKLI
jgi:hypothetical protein